MRTTRILALLACVVGLVQPFGAKSPVEWARFRGPNGSGVAEADRPPVMFGPSDKLLWKTAIPPGHSSPVIWNDHIFLTAVENAELVTLAFRRKAGTLLWRRVAPTSTIEPVHEFNSPAAPTPVTDGERVYAYFGSYGLLAYDFDGNEVWRQPLTLLPTRNGTATSPIVVNGKVVLQRDGNSTESEILALEAKTGAVLWRTPRPLLRGSYSTPVVWKYADREEIVTVGTSRVVAYSDDGVERWWVAGLTDAPITIPVVGRDLLYASSTYTGSDADPIDFPKWETILTTHDVDKDGRVAISEMPADVGIVQRPDVTPDTPGNFLPLRAVLEFADTDKDAAVSRPEWEAFLGWVTANKDNALAIRPGGTGDSTASHVAWTATRGLPEIPSPLFYRDRLYFVRSGGMVTSYAPDTGKVVLERQRLGVLGQYVASPVAADGRIYSASATGTVVVFRAADNLDVLARNDLQESITATPAIADNKLYIRTAAHLWAFGD